MKRLLLDEWAISLALITSKRSTCLKRQVGCVLLNQRNHVIATGYNGPASGMIHCNNCKIKDSKDDCPAIHAEQNALLQCLDVYKISVAYITRSPCVICLKLLLNTSCERIVFLDNSSYIKSKDLWLKANRTWEQIKFEGICQN